MTLLSAAVVIVGLIAVVDLMFSLALARRIRLVADGDVHRNERPAPVPAVGHVVAPFETRTVSGDRLTLADFASPSVAVFATAGCSPCERLKDAILADPPAEALRVFIYGATGNGLPPIATELAAISDEVVWMGTDDALPRAFGGVIGYPTLLRVVNGVVVASGTKLGDIQVSPETILTRA